MAEETKPEVKTEADVITKVFNKDAKIMHHMFFDLKDEIELSVTAQGHERKDADIKRFKSFIAEIRETLEHIQAKPEIDAPKVYPKSYDIKPMPENRLIENEVCEALVDEIFIVDYQMIASSSAQRRLIAFNDFDYARLVDGLDRLDLKIEHLAKVKPVDKQESTPMVPIAGHGQQTSYN